MLPTPTAHDGSSNGISAASRQGGPSLLDQLRLLPTPTASDAKKRHLQDPHRGSVPARRGPAAGDAEGLGHRHGGTPSGSEVAATTVPAGASPGRPRSVAAHASGDRRDEGLPGATGLQGRPDAALGGPAPACPAGGRRHLVAVPDPADQEPATSAAPQSPVDWGDYSPAVRRWEHLLGRRAPCPTQPGRHGRPVLAPAFVEWLQGLPPGWVTSLPLPRTAQLRALGNGVVPHQAAYAVALLLADLAALLAETDAHPGHGPEANAA